ncbi:MAG TPA: NUDIX hydrolase [Luteimonas sp.]|nr:NUDIX hydrolase [Luteimonas sp.]
MDATAVLRASLDDYARRWPDEAGTVAAFRELLDDAEDPFRRERLAGHFTASAWLVDATGTRVLLTHHRKLGRWLQLGGHADGDRDLAAAALREAQEESGLQDLDVEPAPFDLDSHPIPARSDTPAHAHYDVRYVVHARGATDFVVSAESLALAWRDIRGLRDDPDTDPSLRRMADKWLARSA